MTKTICGKIYDTDSSEIVKKLAIGEFGDETGYEETLYKTEGGMYFLYVNGGEQSIHPEESIKRMSKASAEKWLSENA